MAQEDVGMFLASLRKEKKLTQEQLAERLGVNSRSVSRWENGICMPDYALLPLLAKELDVSVLLNGIACKEDVKKYKLRMRVNPFTDTIYPNYFIPPYNGNKKLPMVNGKLPKTHILYANHYELEILRLLFLVAPEQENIRAMIESTLIRLKNTCYGNNCPQGECVAAGKCVLRFLKTVCPEEWEWIRKLEEG